MRIRATAFICLLVLFGAVAPASAQTVVQITSCPWTVPSNYQPGTVEIIGAGAGGQSGTTSNDPGGAGGGYAKDTSVSLTPSSSVNCQLGVAVPAARPLARTERLGRIRSSIARLRLAVRFRAAGCAARAAQLAQAQDQIPAVPAADQLRLAAPKTRAATAVRSRRLTTAAAAVVAPVDL
jgi:hypothetical protein